MRLALLGPPGSGKGTQGAVLAKHFAMPHVSSGDLLRDAVQCGGELGLKAREYMDRGQLVPDQLVLGLIGERIASDDCANGFLLDGFPRTLAQAEALKRLLGEGGTPLEHVLSLSVDREDVVARLGGRRGCPSCGRLYHVRFQPPKHDLRCDDCTTELVVRNDDREETIRQRLAVYQRETAPLLDFYRSDGLLSEVDGKGTPQEVSARILRLLEHGDG